MELIASLEGFAPGGSHDPTAVPAESHATDFVTDQRRRAQHGLKSLGIHHRPGDRRSRHAGELSIATDGTLSTLDIGGERTLHVAELSAPLFQRPAGTTGPWEQLRGRARRRPARVLPRSSGRASASGRNSYRP
ncbi:hypothetical protein [Streptomyces europaeiscabiei]|uniref:hypothetical protein n=1 Tax=Streptomyces europaeiscabiei TaxID=146819 RepID=UPI0038F63209